MSPRRRTAPRKGRTVRPRKISHRSDALSAAALANRAMVQLHAARRQLAKSAAKGLGAFITHGRWKTAQHILDAHRDALASAPGVSAFGLGHRRRRGALTDEPCVVVYVASKHPATELAQRDLTPLPRELRLGRNRVGVDVVEFGGVRHFAAAGDSIGRMEEPTTLGTIGAFGVDNQTGVAVAFTANHVVENGKSVSSPSVRENPTAPRIGAVLRASREVDAAAVALDAGITGVNQLPFGAISGWRPLLDADLHAGVSMHGAKSHTHSGFIEALHVTVTTIAISDALLVEISAREGDSGASLLDVHGAVLALVLGGGAGPQGNLVVAIPIGRVLAALDCSL